MNFKLFIFVVFGIASINSSIIRNESINELIDIDNLNVVGINANQPQNPFSKIKSLTFNVSDTVFMGNKKYPELQCRNFFGDNDYCSKGNGKYQAKIAKCENKGYPEKFTGFNCKLFGAKILNKNVIFEGSKLIACLTGTTQETSKKRCRMEYYFSTSPIYDEADDVENEDEL